MPALLHLPRYPPSLPPTAWPGAAAPTSFILIPDLGGHGRITVFQTALHAHDDGLQAPATLTAGGQAACRWTL